MTSDNGGWQPIETAPKGEAGPYKSGPQILGVVMADDFSWSAYNIVRWEWHKNAKTGAFKGPYGVWKATHWMPLPPPPADAMLAARGGGRMTIDTSRAEVERVQDEELIARLREIQGQAGLFASAAADRIEALVRDKRWIMEERDRTFAMMLTRAEVAEQLAQERLEHIVAAEARAAAAEAETHKVRRFLKISRDEGREALERAEAAEAEVEKLREVERAARKLEENLGVKGVDVGSLRVDLYRALAALKGADNE